MWRPIGVVIMPMMPLRLVIAMLLSLHAFVAWGGASTGIEAFETIAGLTEPEDACGGSCCCPPKACPCVAAPAPREQSPTPPAVPPKSERNDGPKIPPRPASLALVSDTDIGAAGPLATTDAWGASLWMAGRRVQQIQCVWLM